jgi:outer membrane protein assembly factor BamB
MWTKPLQEGGVVGGSNTFIDGATFYDGTAYQGKVSAPLIMNGRLYYNLPKSDTTGGTFGATDVAGGYACVDLRTGEEIYWQNMSLPTFGQLYYYESMNQHGVIPNGYLYTSDENPFAAFFGLPPTPATWTAYNPLDGNWLFNLTNVPGGTDVYGPNGEILRYVLNSTANWLACWNNTAAHGLTGAFLPWDTTSSWYYQWRPVGKTVDASEAYSWNVTIPSLPGLSSPTIVKVIPDDLVFGRSTSFMGISDWGTPEPWTMWAIDLKPGRRGNLLWLKDYQAPADNLTLYQGPVDPETRVFTMWARDGLTWSGYNLDDGSLLWTTEPEDEWAFYAHTAAVADGKLYSCGTGSVYCYNLTDGSLLWTYGDPSGLATPYPNYPLAVTTIADGKVYVGTIEHSRGAPYWKGAQLHCLNATTGDAMWTLLMATPSTAGGLGAITTGYAVADGYYVTLNLYDMQIYCIGKGPSATSVTASPKVSVHGGTVLVEGSVIDIAAGTGQDEQAARFPNGVPAVSDESMSEWMEYVYMQKPKPSDVTGVEIVVSVLDPNNNFYEVGRTTSDEDGFYKVIFKPLVPGEYTVIASFEGSNSYWPSQSRTALYVEEAPAATPEPTPPPASAADMYFLPVSVGTIIAIIAVGLLLFLLLRKR